jgi:hypothetical protein
MYPMTVQQLSQLVERLSSRAPEISDELLSFLLILAYPTRVSQNS